VVHAERDHAEDDEVEADVPAVEAAVAVEILKRGPEEVDKLDVGQPFDPKEHGEVVDPDDCGRESGRAEALAEHIVAQHKHKYVQRKDPVEAGHKDNCRRCVKD